MPELGSLGSVRGALSNGRPYREQHGVSAQEMSPSAQSRDDTPLGGGRDHSTHLIASLDRD